MDRVPLGRRPQFGARLLEKDSDIFSFNAWDDVDWSESQKQEVIMHIQRNSSSIMDSGKEHPSYNKARCSAFVWNVTETPHDLAEFPLRENSLDVVLMIFFLSALDPSKMQAAVNNVTRYLKPNGLLLFRDYAKYDLAQLRFKSGRCISGNFYARGDNTRVYFFEQDQLDEMLRIAGLEKIESRLDRRLQTNRAKLLKMYRIWLQCKYVKK